jgi:hypothetical protein
MSVDAISWALNLAPVPADRGGQPSSACKFVLVGLANHAGPDGSGAFPSARTLMRYTGLSERTVRACLGRLEAAGGPWPRTWERPAASVPWEMAKPEPRQATPPAEQLADGWSARSQVASGCSSGFVH